MTEKAPAKTGARSPAIVAQHARAEKRRFLRQTGLRIGDLDGVALAYLDGWSRAQAKIALMDRWIAEHGFLDDDGNPPPFIGIYFTAINSARLAISRLQACLPEQGDFEAGLRGLIENGSAVRKQREAEGPNDE